MTDDLNLSNVHSGNSLDDPNGLSLVELESAAFVEYENWMDAQLASLVNRWIHTAAPNASRPQLGRGRRS